MRMGPSDAGKLTFTQLDNNAEDIMRLVSEVLTRVSPVPGTKWQNRIVLGCWAVSVRSYI